MSFRLTDDQRALQDAVRAFVRDACDGGVRRRAFEGDGFDREFWAGIAALGVTGVGVGSAHGGLGLPLIDLALVAEALGAEAAPGPFLGHALAALMLEKCGSEAQKARYLPALAAGELLGSIALRSHDGDNRDVLYGPLAGLIVAETPDGRLCLIEETQSIVWAERNVVDRTRRFYGASLDLKDAQTLPGADASTLLMDALAVLIAADAFGGASRMLDLTCAHVRQRVQFGAPIGSFQGVKHQLANLAAEIEPARGLYWYAALAFDERPAERSRAASLAKAHLTDRFVQTARIAIELHGGIGYTWEHDLQIWFKRALFDYAYGGTPSVHRRRAMCFDNYPSSGSRTA